MSTLTNNGSDEGTAEERFRSAFERLRLGVPRILPKGAAVSQNNVAKEAKCDPSALRKSRFPILILEIQEWIEANRGDQIDSKRQGLLRKRNNNRDNREMIADLRRQRDVVAGMLGDANLRILELTEELAEVREKLNNACSSGSVVNIGK